MFDFNLLQELRYMTCLRVPTCLLSPLCLNKTLSTGTEGRGEVQAYEKGQRVFGWGVRDGIRKGYGVWDTRVRRTSVSMNVKR